MTAYAKVGACPFERVLAAMWKERSFDNLCKIEGKLTFSRVNKGPLSIWSFGYVSLFSDWGRLLESPIESIMMGFVMLHISFI